MQCISYGQAQATKAVACVCVVFWFAVLLSTLRGGGGGLRRECLLWRKRHTFALST